MRQETANSVLVINVNHVTFRLRLSVRAFFRRQLFFSENHNLNSKVFRFKFSEQFWNFEICEEIRSDDDR